MKYILSISCLLLLLSSCSPDVFSTLPHQPHAAPFDQAETVLFVPAGLRVVSVDYDAEIFMESNQGTTSREGEKGRAFVSVYAEDRQTGEQYLLIYESLLRQMRPIQVIRFQEE